MSQQAVYDVEFKDEQLLLEALKDMGCRPVVHEKAVPLKTYGSGKKVKAHIVLGQSQHGYTYSDLGFERTKKGFKLHADHSDIRKLNLGKLKQGYSKAFLKKRLKLLGTQYFMGEEKIDQKGQMKLKIKIME